jgi:hypothetical protein
MLEELYMRDLANAMRMPEEVLPTGKVTVSGPQVETAPKQPEMGTITGIPQTAFEKALETSGVKLSELGDMIDQSAPGTLNTLLGREVPIIGNLKLRDFLPFVGSKDEGKLTGTPAALIAAGTGQPLGGQPVVGSSIGPDGQRYYGTSGSPAMLNEDVGTAAIDVATLGLGRPLAAGAKRVVQATKDLPIGMSIKDVSESMKAANAWANPKAFLAQIEDAAQKENMTRIDKNMRQYAEQGMPLSKIKKELERDIGLKLSPDQIDYVSGFVKSKGKAEAPLAAKPITFTGLSPQSLPIAQKIVSDGIASNMSATKMIQAVEQQTGTKLTGKQQKELKDYVSANVPKGQIYSDQAFKDLVAKPFPFEPSTQRFEKAFNDAISYVKTAAPETIRNLAIQANQRLAPILGVGADGKTKRLLTTNGKLLKTETGIEGGVPIELPDGRNIESAGLAISPAFKANKFSTCPNSASCAQECLGKTSGGYFAYGGGADLDAMKGTRLRSFRMTQAMFREPEAFAIKLNEEIFSLKKAAEKNGNALAIRLNVLSDIDPKVHKSIIEANPDVLFYDYTKMKYRPVAPNHHYTYSSTGLSQKAGQNGLTVDVDNPHTNWAQMRQWLDDGQNVAMAFSSKKGLPESVLDEATGKIYKVIDGDAYDFRPMDAQPAGFDGVIVGLKNKAMTRKESLAAQDSKGFFVQYDPKLGTQVNIPRQKKEVIMLKTEGQTTPSPMDTGEQITERAAK